MSDSLRDRIAAAIYAAFHEEDRKFMVNPIVRGASKVEGELKPVAYVLADAVIAELAKYKPLALALAIDRAVNPDPILTDWKADDE